MLGIGMAYCTVFFKAMDICGELVFCWKMLI